MEKEIWKNIPGYEGLYEVSSFGRVKSLSRPGSLKERFLKTPTTKRQGYPYCHLHKDKTRKDFRVHVLVAMAFLEHIPYGNTLVVDHINGDTSNNYVNNLRIVTNTFNCHHAFRKNVGFEITFSIIPFFKKYNNWKISIRLKKLKKSNSIK